MSLAEYFENSLSQGVELSVEEVGLVDSGLTEATVEVNSGFEDITHLEDMGVNLESLKSSIESIESATENDIRLVHIATESIMGSVGVGTQSLLPSLESAEGSTISTEGVGKALSDLWKAIVRGIRKVWDAILRFFGLLKDKTKSLQKRNDEVAKKFKDLGSAKPKKDKIQVDNVAEMMLKGRSTPITKGKDVTELLRQMGQQADFVYSDYVERLVSTGEALTDALKQFDPKDIDGSLNQVVKAAETMEWEKLENHFSKMGGQNVNVKKWNAARVKKASDNLGGRSLFFVAGSKSPDNTPSEKAEHTSKFYMLYENSNPDQEPETQKKLEFDTLSVKEGDAITKHNADILKALDKMDSKKQKAIDKARQDLEKAGSDLTERISNSDDVSDSAKNSVQMAQRFVKSYSEWVAKPTINMGKHYTKAVQSVLVVCSKSLEAYEDDSKKDD